GPHLAPALKWLRGAAVSIDRAMPPEVAQAWDRTALDGDVEGFHHYCRIAASCRPGTGSPTIRKAARLIAQADLRVLEHRQNEPVPLRLLRLDRLSLLAQIFEPGIWLAETA
ncbi:hypothetical protein, partial [Paracoccus sp. (in: a-proteobacteria)]